MADSRYGVKIERSAPLRLPPNPQNPKTETWRKWARRQERPLAVDLFAGCGGLSLGLENAGFKVALAVDHEPWALETHRHNFSGPALDLDLGAATSDPVASVPR